MGLWNTLKTTLLLASLTALLMAVGAAFGGRVGMGIALLAAVAMNMGAWWFSDKVALRMSGARPLAPGEAPTLQRAVEELAARAAMPTPALYLIESEQPNAFATGRDPQHGAVAVTTGLMRLLDADEVAGVIAHELAHIRHRDTLLSSLVATLAGAITMMAEFAQWALIFSGLRGSDEEEGGLGGLVSSLLMLFLAPIAALLIQMAISRAREFKADAGGAALLGDPLPLASALEKLEWAAGQQGTRGNPAAAHLYIVNPLRGGLGGLFRTHPDSSERISRLRALACQRLPQTA